MTVKVKFTEQLLKKQLREGRQIPITEVAEAVGEVKQTLYNWRDGVIKQVPLDTLGKLCNYFPCGVEELLVIEREEPVR